MNLSDVKTQSSPECGLPKGRRFRVETAGRDHKSLTLATVSAVVYLIVNAYRRLLCNRDVKEKACRSWLPHSYSPSSVRKRCIKIETGERDRGWQGDGNGPLGFLILLYGERTRWRRDEEKEGRRTKRGKKKKEVWERLRGEEKVANSKTFRGPIISNETTVRHCEGYPVYLDF